MRKKETLGKQQESNQGVPFTQNFAIMPNYMPKMNEDNLNGSQLIKFLSKFSLPRPRKQNLLLKCIRILNDFIYRRTSTPRPLKNDILGKWIVSLFHKQIHHFWQIFDFLMYKYDIHRKCMKPIHFLAINALNGIAWDLLDDLVKLKVFGCDVHCTIQFLVFLYLRSKN